MHSFLYLKMMEQDTLPPSEFPKIVSEARECHACKRMLCKIKEKKQIERSDIFSRLSLADCCCNTPSTYNGKSTPIEHCGRLLARHYH